MTSVKELGETLRKRQAVVEGADATEGAMFGAVGSSYAVLLVSGGCLVLALGALMASVGVLAPDYLWMAESLERMGITSGAVLAAGLVLLGLGVVAKEVAQAQRALLGAVRRSNGTGGLAETQEEIKESLGKVHFALRVLQESTKNLLEISHESSYKREEGEHGDAVFRLAASLDQLGVRLEDRLDSQQSGIERRLGSLDAALDETRRRMADWIEKLESTPPPPAPQPATARVQDGEEFDEPAPRRGKRRKRASAGANELNLASAETRRGERRRRMDLDGDEELEVLVTLEERGEREARPNLGVLDVLDEFGQGLAGQDDDEATADFLFDAKLAARLEELSGELDGESADDTQAKLAQLQDLLSDSRLRRMLGELRDAKDDR